jgi:hypothetical protein
MIVSAISFANSCKGLTWETRHLYNNCVAIWEISFPMTCTGAFTVIPSYCSCLLLCTIQALVATSQLVLRCMSWFLESAVLFYFLFLHIILDSCGHCLVHWLSYWPQETLGHLYRPLGHYCASDTWLIDTSAGHQLSLQFKFCMNTYLHYYLLNHYPTYQETWQLHN